MSRSVIFTDDALEILLSIKNYIAGEWGSRQADKFLMRVDKVLKLTAENPYMYKVSSIEETARKGLISKQTSFYYEIHENEILILFFWDNRQDSIFTG
ncbi:type II toxin-antitoxin system RelE/ParE family toxin [uncultured Mucilaginibacter sp.]|uniref:type II toxin-antitoxin system RelE/ParE family toxin n=1 Tax=uncultured Mucilaginibacter sp. TaxID=797541 RepID=UPI0025F2EC2E|nr:type II toxin-antitoxin system RelE/ParE family toxin [uncultured Mucilaginibacter sp.]